MLHSKISAAAAASRKKRLRAVQAEPMQKNSCSRTQKRGMQLQGFWNAQCGKMETAALRKLFRIKFLPQIIEIILGQGTADRLGILGKQHGQIAV